MSKQRIYKILFNNQGNVYELYAKSFTQGAMLGFIEIEGLIFGEKSSVVVDPSEEKLKAEFSGVNRIYIPMHAVIRVDEVEKSGTNKIIPLGKANPNVTPFPSTIVTPPKDPGGK